MPKFPKKKEDSRETRKSALYPLETMGKESPELDLMSAIARNSSWALGAEPTVDDEAYYTGLGE